MTSEELMRVLVKKYLGEEYDVVPDLTVRPPERHGVIIRDGFDVTRRKKKGCEFHEVTASCNVNRVGCLSLSGTTLQVSLKQVSLKWTKYVDLNEADDEKLRKVFATCRKRAYVSRRKR
jgi:hypothetical protein